MAVRLLAGPFELLDNKGQKLNVSIAGHTWYPGVGLLFQGYRAVGVASGGCWCATLDGVCVFYANFASQGRNWGWWPSKRKLVYKESDAEYVYEPRILMRQKTSPEDQKAGNQLWQKRYVKLLDRRVYVSSSDLKYLTNAGIEGVECSYSVFRDVGIYSIGDVLPGRGEHEIFVSGISYAGLASHSGNVDAGCFYDTIARKISSPTYTIAPMGALYLGYCPEYGVLISTHYRDDGYIDLRVWSLEVLPTLLTDPVPITNTQIGQVVTYQVQLTGASQDPAEGELVEWTVSGVGELFDAQSKTNAQGYATARVGYGLQDTGPSTVEARVIC